MPEACQRRACDDPAVQRTGGRIVVDQLRRHGLTYAACVPGESFLDVLDGLRDEPWATLLVCRHESAAANAADAFGKLTSRPGVCLVTRGPGAMQAAVGLHTARQDGTPLLLLVGQVQRAQRGRMAFQEVDYRRAFDGVVKWAGEAERAADLPALIAEAVAAATGGLPGPAVLALPEDVLAEAADVPDAEPVDVTPPAPAPAALTEAQAVLQQAARPLAIAGGGAWSEAAAAALAEFASASGIPVASAFRCQDFLDNEHPAYVGPLGLASSEALRTRLRDADVILAVGTRLDAMTTAGYTLLEAPQPRQRLIHVLPDDGELGRVYEPAIAIHADPAAFLAALPPIDGRGFVGWRVAARAEYEAHRAPQDPIGQLMAAARAGLPDDAVLTNGAGNYTHWCHRFLHFRRYGTQLAPRSGAMGYGVPAALAAAAVHRDRPAVAFAGDGCFMMAAAELATAVRHRLPIVVVVLDNGLLGTIRMHQERRFPGRTFATDLANPDFVALAESFGLYAERVEDGLAGPLGRALASGRPALLHVPIDPDTLTP
jgi:acetolactate synthase-1/2/3 large subunit